jgi:alanine racemase
MSRATTAQVDLAALRHNLEVVRQRAPHARVMAVVKANAYGHGLDRAIRALAGADAFAVACIEEALAVRAAGLRHPVVLLEGALDAAEYTLAVHHGFEPVVHVPEQLAMLERLNSSSVALKVWLKIDTGMNRLGFRPTAACAAWGRLQRMAAVRQPPGLMTHLASADEPGSERTSEQLRLFAQATKGLAGERSLANSAGVLGWPASHADWVRPGIMLYGISPFPDRIGAAEGLKPVMSLTTRLIAVKAVTKGETVGYGGTWTAEADSILGIAAIGYGDGYPRHAANGTPVLVNGRRAALAGRVSMDMIAIDLGARPNARVGDPVLLWGTDLPAEEVARAAGTIAYELLCKVTPRVKMIYSGQEPNGQNGA